MVKMHQELNAEGFQIFAFPCNQFLGQEACSNDDIKTFVKDKYGVDFPMFAKCEVNGPNSHDVFKFCRKNSPLFDNKSEKLQSIPWNFTKFLIDKNGKVAGFFTPKENPSDCVKMIKLLLDDEHEE